MTTLDIGERTVMEHGESVTYKFNLIMSTKDSCRYDMKRIHNNKTQNHVFDIDFNEIHIAKSIPTFIWELAECNSRGMILQCIDVVYENTDRNTFINHTQNRVITTPKILQSSVYIKYSELSRSQKTLNGIACSCDM